MDINIFRQMNLKEASQAYNQLRKVSKVVFSGNINPSINQLDYAKVKERLKKKNLVSEQEMQVIEQLIAARRDLENRQMEIGLWEGIITEGHIPHAREGAAGVLIG